MIKSIYFKKTNSLNDNEQIRLDFSKHINVIIGPKGGGKSTLFDLLAGIKKNIIYDSVKSALNFFGLEFVKATTFANEEITLNDLTLKKAKLKEDDYKERNDVIYQDDPIKKDINSFKDIKKQKESFLKDVMSNSSDINRFINEIEKMHIKVCNFEKLNEKKIFWNSTFNFQKTNKELDIIRKLNYDNGKFSSNINKEKQDLESFISKSNDALEFYKKLRDNYNCDLIYIDKQFKKDLNEKINILIKTNEELIEILKKKEKFIYRIEKILRIFSSVYIRKVEEIKNKSDELTRLKEFENNSKEYFRKFASQVKELKREFKKLLQTSICIKLKDIEKTCKFLSYRIDNKIILDDDFIIEKVLKNYFYTPTKSITDIGQWITKNRTQHKEFSQDSLEKSIMNFLVDKVEVLANGENYKNMSLGEKSIYGIKFKFQNSMNDDLFLDQPEDNLDNHTIAEKILSMISQKNNQQVFIVTHNANIGILSKPEKIIVANIKDGENQYFPGILKKDSNDDSDSAFYLEGGLTYLEQRYKIIKGD